MIVFASVAKAEDYEKVLSPGDLAPFKGVLVPEDGYRFYQIDVKSLERCKSRLEAGVVACPSCEPELFTSKQLMFFIGGIALGFMAANSAR